MRHASVVRAAQLAAIGAILAGVSACTMKSQEAPGLTGPSEFGTSITVAASPDILSQDGTSQSLITVTARGPNGEALPNLTLRAELQVDGTAVDFGRMSARNIVTGGDGRATLVYTAPAAPNAAVDTFTIVEVVIVPFGTDFSNTIARSAAIRLVPPGVVIPPDGLAPSFTVAPEAPQESQQVFFDASASQPSGGIVSYTWDYGDRRGGSGRTSTHTYRTAGTYHVTLTIADPFGRTASATKTIEVGAGQNPTPAFVFSPASPGVNQTIAFNASGSSAAPGRRIVKYTWDFGDGKGLQDRSGPTINYSYSAAGDYNVTLVVTDDAGKTAAITSSVTVGP